MKTIDIKRLYDETRQKSANAATAEKAAAEARREAWKHRAKECLSELMALAEIHRPQSYPFGLEGKAVYHDDGEGSLSITKCLTPDATTKFNDFHPVEMFGVRIRIGHNDTPYVVYPENPHSKTLWDDYFKKLVESCAGD